jgi:hypothetical protein
MGSRITPKPAKDNPRPIPERRGGKEAGEWTWRDGGRDRH